MVVSFVNNSRIVKVVSLWVVSDVVLDGGLNKYDGFGGLERFGGVVG